MKTRRLYPILAIISALFFVLALIGSVFHNPEQASNDKEKIVKNKVEYIFNTLRNLASDPQLHAMLERDQEDLSEPLLLYLQDQLRIDRESSIFIWKEEELVYWNIGIYSMFLETSPRSPHWDVLIRNQEAYVKWVWPSGHRGNVVNQSSPDYGIQYVLPLNTLLKMPTMEVSTNNPEITNLAREVLHRFLTFQEESTRSHFVLTLYLFGYLFLFSFLFFIGHQLTHIYSPARVLIGLIAVFVVLRCVGFFFPLSHPTSSLLFRPQFLGPGIPGSLADYLINIVLGFCLALFFYTHFPKDWEGLNKRRQKIFALLSYLFFSLGTLLFAFHVKIVVHNPHILLDINVIENFTPGSMVLLFAIFFLMLTFFIIMSRLLMIIHHLGLDWKDRLMLFAPGVIVGVVILLASPLGINPFLWVISQLIILLLFDLFLDSSMRDFTWVSVWLLILSLFSTVLFAHFYTVRLSEESRQTLLAKISVPDPNLIMVVKELMEKSSGSGTQSRTFESILNDVVFTYPGVRNQYRFSMSRNKIPTTLDSLDGIRYHFDPTWPGRYLFPIQMNRQRSLLQVDAVGTELLSTTQTGSHSGHVVFSTGDWTVYDRRVITNNESLFFPPFLDSLVPVWPADNLMVRDSQFVRDHTIYTLVEHGNRAALGRQDYDGLLQPMSFFSFNFILFLLLFGLLLTLHRLIQFLPRELHQYFVENLSIRNKIQFSVLAILIAAFTVVGIVSANFYKRSYKETLERTVKEYYQKVKRADFTPDEIMKVFEGIPGNYILFNSQGRAIQNNKFQEFNYLPYNVVRKINLSTTLDHFDEIWPGALVLPFALDPQRTVFLVYPEISDVPDGFYRFINLLLNAFVFLLLISSALSFSISHTIISPLTELGNKLKEFSLGKRNESIPWKQPDELGTLIQAYNDMVDKLEQSAELLAHSEREVAWREMAKQVAHEIKNPLTPMKLSIQHMESRIQKAEAEEAREIVRHVSKVLIEQIDNLSRIASEFSSFANLPKPEYEEILLNDLVASVYDLFRTRSNIKFNLYVPIDELMVQADRTHLIRVMNNLMKNAVQAIPPEREGHIVIRLLEKKSHAVVRVEDNGKGIEDELHEKVFFPNFTTKSSGTGLGLAISKNIIETFDGSIYFVKNKPEGTVFIFELPLVNP